MAIAKEWLVAVVMVVVFSSCFLSLIESRSIGVDKSALPRIWCVANPFKDMNLIQQQVDGLCEHLDCKKVKPGGDCFMPNTTYNHASFVFNLYFKQHKLPRQGTICTDNVGGLLTYDNPSNGNCFYR